MSANKNSATPADVAAAAEEKKNASTVPAQVNPEGDSEATEGVCDEVDNSKKSFKERLTALGTKLKENKKAFVVLGVVAATSAVAYAKYAAKKAAEAVEDGWTDVDEAENELGSITEEQAKKTSAKTK